MPISGQGWEIHLQRQTTQTRPSDGKVRTVGRYQVFHNGRPAPGNDMSGMFAESRGPGSNSPAGNGKRVEWGTYPLWTQAGERYVTYNYVNSTSSAEGPKPGIELMETGDRREILIHPGVGFLASIGCINLCFSLPNASEAITYQSSRRRVISVIEDMKAFIGAQFPGQNGKKIPRASCVIDGEP